MARSPNAAHIDAEQLASLSHEFRTPLNGVLGMTRLLEGTGLSAEQKTYVAALRESGEHLLGLVNDVLDFAKLGAGQTDLNPVTFDLEGLLRAVCELLAPRAQEKGLEIAWSVPAGMGQVLADEGRLRQILLNFAGNAIKFTGSGGVLLSLTETAPDRLKFTVSDTGPGVSDAARDRIFEAFAQADPAYDGAQLGGAGLGLAIARKLAASMGGEVGLEPAWGDGASFWFEATLPHRPRQTDPVLVGLNLGLATQNPVLRAAAKGQIEASGGAVCDHSQPDLWLVDYVGEPLTPIVGAPCIVLLEPRHRSQIEAFRKDGFAGYLIKPLRRSSLSERVLAALAAGADRMSSVDDERVAPALAAGTRVLLVEAGGSRRPPKL